MKVNTYYSTPRHYILTGLNTVSVGLRSHTSSWALPSCRSVRWLVYELTSAYSISSWRNLSWYDSFLQPLLLPPRYRSPLASHCLLSVSCRLININFYKNVNGAGEETRTLTHWTQDPKSCASSNSATPAYMVGHLGLEPRTARLWAGCSNQLS